MDLILLKYNVIVLIEYLEITLKMVKEIQNLRNTMQLLGLIELYIVIVCMITN